MMRVFWLLGFAKSRDQKVLSGRVRIRRVSNFKVRVGETVRDAGGNGTLEGVRGRREEAMSKLHQEVSLRRRKVQ
jgi:hypothetical protein